MNQHEAADADLASRIRNIIERGTFEGHIAVGKLTPDEQTWWRDGNWTDFESRTAGLIRMRNAEVADMIAHHRATAGCRQIAAARALAQSWKAHNTTSHLEQKPLADAANQMLKLLEDDTP